MVIVENSKDSAQYKTFHSRQFVTECGEYECFEGGRYFVISKGQDKRGILRQIAELKGVESAWTKGYGTTVKIGKAFNWEGDQITEQVTAILESL